MKNLILIAAPGAGKGTLSNDILEKYDYVHISTGDLLREQVAKGDELGKEIEKVQQSGGLVSNEIVYKALEQKLQDPKCDNGYILDGFPRNLEQAKEYDKILKKSNRDLGLVLVLDIPKEDLIKRITGRFSCKECGEIHNIYSRELKPKKEGKCNKCGGELIQRKDDNLESLTVRLQEYHKNTQPVIEYYEKAGLVANVDAKQGVDEVFGDIRKLLEGLC